MQWADPLSRVTGGAQYGHGSTVFINGLRPMKVRDVMTRGALMVDRALTDGVADVRNAMTCQVDGTRFQPSSEPAGEPRTASIVHRDRPQPRHRCVHSRDAHRYRG